MLKQMVEFAEKNPRIAWNGANLINYLEKYKRNFFFAVDTKSDLRYDKFQIIGIENPFPKEKNLTKKFVNLEKWISKNVDRIKYTEFEWYRKPIGTGQSAKNSAIGSASGFGTKCLSHFQLKMKKDTKIKDFLKAWAGEKRKIQNHVKALKSYEIGDIDCEKLKELYIGFFKEIDKCFDDETINQLNGKEIIFVNEKIFGKIPTKKEERINIEGICPITGKKDKLFFSKFFNVGAEKKKPFIMYSRTRPVSKYNLMISNEAENKIQEFMVKIFSEIGTPFILPIDERIQKRMAGYIAQNEENFFKTVENLLSKKDANIEDRFDFYFVDIRGGKINFFDYVSNYNYCLANPFCHVFPIGVDKKPTPFNRRNIAELIVRIFGQKNLPCLPWVDPPEKMNTSKKSAYIQLREKMFETIYLGKAALSQAEIEALCLMLIEDSIINDDYNKANWHANTCLNFFVNSYLYTIGGESMGNSLMLKAEKIEEQVSKRLFKPTDNESGFYLLGLLLKRLCDNSETSNEKSRLLQPIINTHTILGLNRVVMEKFVEKYAYKIGEKDNETTSLISNVLPFFAEQNGEESIKDFKLWLYAGFFSNHEWR
jgi:hypothetical protein